MNQKQLLRDVQNANAKFEAWATTTNQGYDLTREDGAYMATYKNNSTEHAWRGYCHASLTQTAGPVDAEPVSTIMHLVTAFGAKCVAGEYAGGALQHVELALKDALSRNTPPASKPAEGGEAAPVWLAQELDGHTRVVLESAHLAALASRAQPAEGGEVAIDSTCSETLRQQGKPYPRTCRKCG